MLCRGTGGCGPWDEGRWAGDDTGVGGHNRDLPIPKKEIIEGTEPRSSAQSDGRDWNEGEPGGTSGNAFQQEEKQQDLVPVGLCSLHIWRTPRSNKKGPGGSPELTQLHPSTG